MKERWVGIATDVATMSAQQPTAFVPVTDAVMQNPDPAD